VTVSRQPRPCLGGQFDGLFRDIRFDEFDATVLCAYAADEYRATENTCALHISITATDILKRSFHRDGASDEAEIRAGTVEIRTCPVGQITGRFIQCRSFEFAKAFLSGRPNPSNLCSGHAIACAGGEAMSDESEVGIVLANAPRLERAFGRKLAAFMTLVGLYFARRRSFFWTGVLSIAGPAALAWLAKHGLAWLHAG
jgi:hypothetical protein